MFPSAEIWKRNNPQVGLEGNGGYDTAGRNEIELKTERARLRVERLDLDEETS